MPEFALPEIANAIRWSERLGAPLVTADETLARRSPVPPRVVRLGDPALS